MGRLTLILLSIIIFTGVVLASAKGITKKEFYNSETEAVTAFYKNNTPVLKSLTKDQEMLGWVVECEEGFYVTKAWVGGLSNPLKEPLTRIGCSVVANMHTHPRVPFWLTVDFYSEADLLSTKYWRMYLLSQENCNIRLAVDSENKHGKLIGKLSEC